MTRARDCLTKKPHLILSSRPDVFAQPQNKAALPGIQTYPPINRKVVLILGACGSQVPSMKLTDTVSLRLI